MRQRGMPAQAGIIEIVVLIILALAVAAGAYYFGRISSKQEVAKTQEKATPAPEQTIATPDPTANWETYTNTKFKYTFKYPPNTTVYSRVESLPGNEKERDITTTCCMEVVVNDKAVFGTEVFEDGKSIEEHKERLSEDPAVSGMEETTFAGERALVYMYTSVKTLTVVHGGASYNFLFMRGAEDLGDKILSTFKFTSQ